MKRKKIFTSRIWLYVFLLLGIVYLFFNASCRPSLGVAWRVLYDSNRLLASKFETTGDRKLDIEEKGYEDIQEYVVTAASFSDDNGEAQIDSKKLHEDLESSRNENERSEEALTNQNKKHRMGKYIAPALDNRTALSRTRLEIKDVFLSLFSLERVPRPCEMYGSNTWTTLNWPANREHVAILTPPNIEWNVFSRLGNFLGFYFHALALAFAKGIDFFAVFNCPSGSKTDCIKDTILEFFPAYISNESTLFQNIEKKPNFRRGCKHNFPWQYSGTWDYIAPMIRQIVRNALELWASSRSEWRNQTDVLIQFRCSEKMFTSFHDTGHPLYGFFPYKIYDDILKAEGLRDILIETDTSSDGEERCSVLLRELADYLKSKGHSVHFSDDGDPSAVWTRMTFSRLLICSSSTFCLWPAIAANEAYYPETPLIAENKRVNITEHFHWFSPEAFLSAQEIVKRKMGTYEIIEHLRSK